MRGLGALVLSIIVAGCASLPHPVERIESVAVTDTAGTTLGRAVAPGVEANPGKTGIHRLPDPRDAFAARIVIADKAEKSLDVQYFIWHADQVGGLMMEALWNAAERGVRVRLLLDDLNTAGLDATIAALASHPNLQVRLYNPFAYRGPRAIGFLTDFTRLNRRMHNKSFTADNQVSIVGGRNIANEYFGAGAGAAFADIDVIAVGAAVRDVSAQFDLYWNSASAYPAPLIVGPPATDPRERLLAAFAAVRADSESVTYLNAVRDTPLLRELANRALQFEWTSATVVRDDPAKTLDPTGSTEVLLLPSLLQAMGRPEKTLDIVSPYFVPGDGGTAALVAVSKRGVRIRILTNSLAAMDEASVYAGYAKRRQPLLEAGIQLFELKPTVSRGVDDASAFRFGQTPASALHAKSLAVDGQRAFVGSFNFDQRSAKLNTEMGLVVDSPSLAGMVGTVFDVEVPTVAYQVRLAEDGRSLEWIERTPSGETRYTVDPGTSVLKRIGVSLMSLLPIEWLL